MSEVHLNRQAIEFYLDAVGLSAGVLDGHDNAIIGLVTHTNEDSASIAYSKRKILANLAMDWHDALDYYDFNIEPVAEYIGATIVDDVILSDNLVIEPESYTFVDLPQVAKHQFVVINEQLKPQEDA